VPANYLQFTAGMRLNMAAGCRQPIQDVNSFAHTQASKFPQKNSPLNADLKTQKANSYFIVVKKFTTKEKINKTKAA